MKKTGKTSPAPPALLRKIRGRSVRVVGIGGVGSSLASYLARFLWSQNAKAFGIAMDLIDGDHYELQNKPRMLLPSRHVSGSKPAAKAIELAVEFSDRLTVRPVPVFASAENIATLIGERDIVFAAVDNFKSRKIISGRCETLRNIVLFSGGNDGVENGQRGEYGNVQIYERKNGRDIRNPITRFHPEIMFPQDKAPGEISCEELAMTSTPQLLFTNLAVASNMLNAFYAWLTEHLDYEEIYLDVLAGIARAAKRVVGGRGGGK
jgi:molybdopterin/thiamine biosynthesis adenylyltransferase